MYGWLWRHLPGSTASRVMLALTAVIGVVTVLFLWVFPWLAPLLPFQQQTVGN